MKTLSFLGENFFTISGPYAFADQHRWGFIAENKNVIIREITPTCYANTTGYSGNDIPVERLLSSAFINTLDNSKLFYSPVRNTYGEDSPFRAQLIINQVNKVEIRLFAGQQIGLNIPFMYTNNYAGVNDLDVTLRFGFLVTYEEEEIKYFKR